MPIGTDWSVANFDERMEGYEQAARGDFGQRGTRTWHTNQALVLMRPDDGYSPYGFWNSDGDFVCWYINLQLPLTRTDIGFDTMDAVLDLVVAPDLKSWQWKDEHELERVVELGLASKELATQIRSNGESVIALLERGEAWWADWKDWAPDPEWPVPELPEGWDRD